MIWTIYIRCSNIGIAISISVVRSNATWRITCKLWVWCWINYWAYNVEFTTAGTICSLAIGNIVIGSRFIPSIVKLIIAAILFLSFILKNLLEFFIAFIIKQTNIPSLKSVLLKINLKQSKKQFLYLVAWNIMVL